MARSMNYSNGTLFRAVLTWTYEDGHETTSTVGPFIAQAPATAAISRAKRSVAGRSWHAPWRATAVEGVVETADPTWHPLDEPVPPMWTAEQIDAALNTALDLAAVNLPMAARNWRDYIGTPAVGNG